jgi:hypothetical protein
MGCILCRSPKIIKFIDGFGERRVFCKMCGRSFLEVGLMTPNQRSLQEFSIKFHRNIQGMG